MTQQGPDFDTLTVRQMLEYARKLRAGVPTDLTPAEEARVREWESNSIRAGIQMAKASWGPSRNPIVFQASPVAARLDHVADILRKQNEQNRRDSQTQMAANRWALRWASLAVVIAAISLGATLVFGIISSVGK